VFGNSRPQRNRLELLDGSAGASRSGPCERVASENFAGRGRRCRPRSSSRRLQRFSRAVERCRPRHPHPEGSQSGIRQAAITKLKEAGFADVPRRMLPISVSVLKPICTAVYVMPELVCCYLIDGPQPATDSAKDWSGGLNLYLSQRQSSDGCRTC
jgi:hypothetical protein